MFLKSTPAGVVVAMATGLLVVVFWMGLELGGENRLLLLGTKGLAVVVVAGVVLLVVVVVGLGVVLLVVVGLGVVTGLF